jgi:hypothetical protein
MRIFLSCLQSQRKHPIPAVHYWELYFKKGIEEAAYEWVEAEGVDWAEGLMLSFDWTQRSVYCEEKYLREWRDRSWSQTISYLKQQHQIKPIDLFLSYLYPKQIEPTAVQEIQALGIPCVNFFCDNVKFFCNLREFAQLPKEFGCFDLHWVPEFKAITKYQQAGLNYIYAPMPVWIPPEQRTCEHPENYGVSFIGSPDVQRESLFARALQLGASLEIRGPAWTHQVNSAHSTLMPPKKSLWEKLVNQIDFVAKNGIKAGFWKASYILRQRTPKSIFQDYVREPVYGSDYVKVTQQSLLTLGVNRYDSYAYPFSKPDTYSRLRDIEAPMMGACYLTEWAEGLEQLYDLGEEIETYRTAEEMVEKIRELTENSEKRKRMRCYGQKRALSDHTVAKSLYKITATLGLISNRK